MSQIQNKLNNFSYEQAYQENFQENQQQYSSPVIEGYFPKENTIKEMAIRQINSTLTALLFISIFVTAISYYFATANQIVLNNLSRQTIVLNDENFDLQNKLDRLKSFNNVDMTMQKSNMLQKAQQVLEIPEVESTKVSDKNLNIQKPLVWAIGY